MSAIDRNEASAVDHGGPIDHPFEPLPEAVLEGSVVDRFELAARRFGERLAIQDDAHSITYAELAAMVGRIAAATAAATTGRAGPVAVLLPSDFRYPLAMLGVLAAGRAYVPLEDGAPIERNRSILAEAGACAVIVTQALATDFPPDIAILPVEHAVESAHPRPAVRPGADDIAAILYTSGSTGVPKGVAQTHRNVLRHSWLFVNAAHVNCEDRILVPSAANVGMMVRSIFAALLTGASLHMLQPQGLQAAELAQEIRRRRITMLHAIPAVIRRIAEGVDAVGRLDLVRVVSLGGDMVEWSDIHTCRSIFSPRVHRLVNLGSTEVSTICLWFVDDSLHATCARPPVGRPAPDVRLAVVGADGNAVPDGEIGRLVVTSRSVALGYWRGADRPIEAFPSSPADPTCRTFQSNDLGRRRPDGLIEFVGRKDQQVKLHGHRIEPAEVEHVLAGLDEVKDAAIVVRRDADGRPSALVGYVALRPGARALGPRDLQAMLAQRLPRHMVPSRIVLLDEMPRLPGFKIDRARLAEMDKARPPDVGGRDPLVDEVAGVFEQVIDVADAGPDDTIASLGGDSMHAIDIIVELERRFAVTMPDDLMKRHMTIGDVAHWIASQPAARSREQPSAP